MLGIEPFDLAVIVLALAAGAFIKGLTGAGMPQIAIPVAALFLGVERAVILLVIPGIVSNTWLIWTHRAHWRDTRDLPVLLVTGIVGAVAGTFLLKALDPRLLSAVLAVIVLVYVVLRIATPTVAWSSAVTRRVSPPLGLAAGTLQGATGMSGPLLITYVHGYRLPVPAFVLSLAVLFQVYAVAQGVSLVGVGLFTQDRVIEGTLALIPMALALPVGSFVARRVSTRWVDAAVLALLVLSAVALVRTAITGDI